MIITPTLLYLTNLFNEINNTAFAGQLPGVRIELGRATRQLGCFVYPIHINGRPIDNIHRCKIRISTAFQRTHDEYRDTLAHEMVHMYLWLAGVEETHHGPTFIRMMNEINQRCGYNMQVSVRRDSDRTAEAAPAKSYIVEVNWRDGMRTITRVAQTFIFDFKRILDNTSDIAHYQWYGTTDGWFRRYPAVRTPKFFKISDDDYNAHLTNALKLTFRDNYLQPED